MNTDSLNDELGMIDAMNGKTISLIHHSAFIIHHFLILFTLSILFEYAVCCNYLL